MKLFYKIFGLVFLFSLIITTKTFATEELSVDEVWKEAQQLNSAEYEYVEIEDISYINPIYSDEITKEDLFQTSDIMALEGSETCSTIEEAGSVLRTELKSRTQTISISYVSGSMLTSSIYSQIVENAMQHTGVPTEGDYLQWQYGGYTGKAEGYKYQEKYYFTITYTFTYYTTAAQESQMNTAVANLLKQLNLTGTDYDKITKIYDYICSNVKYDYTSSGMLKHTAYAALINKTSVCQGYAVLFYRLALECGIDCRLIAGTGNGGAHGWNIVKIEGYYYNVDATWDANYYLYGFYPYYMKTNENFTNHVRYSEYSTTSFNNSYPMGTSNYTASRNEEFKRKYNGLVLDEQTGIYKYYEQGIEKNYTGIYEQDGEKYYVNSGVVNLKYNGTYTDKTGTYIIKNSKVDTSITTVMKLNGIWRMVQSGKVNYTYNGLGTNDLGTWLIENGKVTFNYNGVYKESSTTYYIEGSKVRTDLTKVIKIDGIWRMVQKGIINYGYNGLGTNENGTWYVQNGRVTLKYNGTYVEGTTAYIIEGSKLYATLTTSTTSVKKINGVWRMIKNGYVDYQYTGIGTNSFGTWIIENGKVTFNYNGVYKESSTTYYIEGSKVRTDLTKVIKIDGIWRMVQKGIINYGYNGLGTNENGTWYVQNGRVTLKYNGTYVEGTTAYIIEGSKLYATLTTSTTSVKKINGVWRMIKNGYVDYQYTGIATNGYGTWILENGKVTFNYNGAYKNSSETYYVEGSKIRTDLTKVIKIDGIWRMVQKGIINYGYNGLGTNENGTWLLQNGKVTFKYNGVYLAPNGKEYQIKNSKVVN